MLAAFLLVGVAAPKGLAQVAPAQSALPQSAPAVPNGPVSVQVSPQIFATMCALDAAGFDANVDTITGIPALIALRQNLLQLHGPATEALRQFYKEHALAGSGETLARYIALALVVGPPPDFQFQVRENLLPGSAPIGRIS